MTCLAVFASAGAAFAACPSQPVTTPFSQWGDTSSYFLVPGGSFEGTPAQVGWSLTGAGLTAGNESSNVNDPADNQSLTIGAGGRATSPYLCLDNTMSDVRFFARQTVPGGGLKVQVLIKTWYGVIPVPVGALGNGSMTSWGPVRQLRIPTGLLPGWATAQMAVRFVVPSWAGSWQVDDVYVDPYRAG